MTEVFLAWLSWNDGQRQNDKFIGVFASEGAAQVAAAVGVIHQLPGDRQYLVSTKDAYLRTERHEVRK